MTSARAGLTTQVPPPRPARRRTAPAELGTPRTRVCDPARAPSRWVRPPPPPPGIGVPVGRLRAGGGPGRREGPGRFPARTRFPRAEEKGASTWRKKGMRDPRAARGSGGAGRDPKLSLGRRGPSGAADVSLGKPVRGGETSAGGEGGSLGSSPRAPRAQRRGVPGSRPARGLVGEPSPRRVGAGVRVRAAAGLGPRGGWGCPRVPGCGARELSRRQPASVFTFSLKRDLNAPPRAPVPRCPGAPGLGPGPGPGSGHGAPQSGEDGAAAEEPREHQEHLRVGARGPR